MSDLFDVINLIHSKERFPTEDEMKVYSAFMGNRAMSQHQDLVFFAEAMNEKWGVPKEANYAFYFYGMPKKKRPKTWAKRNKDEDEKINLLKEYYGYSTIRAREIIPIVDELGLWNHIKVSLNKGGTGKVKKKASPNPLSK